MKETCFYSSVILLIPITKVRQSIFFQFFFALVFLDKALVTPDEFKGRRTSSYWFGFSKH